MGSKQRFTFLIRRDERAILKHLSQVMDRSEAATLRTLIRRAAHEIADCQLVGMESEYIAL